MRRRTRQLRRRRCRSSTPTRHPIRFEQLEPRLLLDAGASWDDDAVGPSVCAASESLSREPAISSYSTLPNGMPILHGRAGAAGAIFLDFDGDAATGNAPYSEDADAASFNAAEQANIVEAWRRTCEYFSMFDLDVTTIQPDTSAVATAWALVTNSFTAGPGGTHLGRGRLS